MEMYNESKIAALIQSSLDLMETLQMHCFLCYQSLSTSDLGVSKHGFHYMWITWVYIKYHFYIESLILGSA